MEYFIVILKGYSNGFTYNFIFGIFKGTVSKAKL